MGYLTTRAIVSAAKHRNKYKYLTERNRGVGAIEAQNKPALAGMTYKYKLHKRKLDNEDKANKRKSRNEDRADKRANNIKVYDVINK